MAWCVKKVNVYQKAGNPSTTKFTVDVSELIIPLKEVHIDVKQLQNDEKLQKTSNNALACV